MENMIKKGTKEYDLANQKIEQILDEVEILEKSFFDTGSKDDAKELLAYLDNYKMIGNHLETFSEKDLEGVQYKKMRINQYLSDKKSLSYVKRRWEKEE
jgi:hypothetical protein